MLKIRGISNAENLLMGVNRFGHCLTTRAEPKPTSRSLSARCRLQLLGAGSRVVRSLRKESIDQCDQERHKRSSPQRGIHIFQVKRPSRQYRLETLVDDVTHRDKDDDSIALRFRCMHNPEVQKDLSQCSQRVAYGVGNAPIVDVIPVHIRTIDLPPDLRGYETSHEGEQVGDST